MWLWYSIWRYVLDTFFQEGFVRQRKFTKEATHLGRLCTFLSLWNCSTHFSHRRLTAHSSFPPFAFFICCSLYCFMDGRRTVEHRKRSAIGTKIEVDRWWPSISKHEVSWPDASKWYHERTKKGIPYDEITQKELLINTTAVRHHFFLVNGLEL